MSDATIRAITASGLTIYDNLQDRPDLFLNNETLEEVLNKGLSGFNLDYENRTRSKVVKARICEILGYSAPNRFKRTRPRFPGQNFDTAVQKANNFQPVNEGIDPSRRYVFVRVDANGVVTRVKVVSGEALAEYDTRGTLTKKFQAKSRQPVTESSLVSGADTPNVTQRLLKSKDKAWAGFLPITDLFSTLKTIIGLTIENPGIGQDAIGAGYCIRWLPSW
jgi:hypothetical protein